MALSVFDLFSIGIGPSSSHTVGPMRAALEFVTSLGANLPRVASLSVDFYGSLGATGIGHGTDGAVMMGLMGDRPETVDPVAGAKRVANVRSSGRLRLAGGPEIAFDPTTDFRWNPRRELSLHSNGMTFTARAADETVLADNTCYSVGGGFIVHEGTDAAHSVVEDATVVEHPFATASELLAICEDTGKSIARIVRENEWAWRTDDEVKAGLEQLWVAMQGCIAAGIATEGRLPGGLGVLRRAPALHAQLQIEQASVDPLRGLDWLTLYALAVNEENAAGGRVVTAPTNGAAGIIPAVLHYYTTFVPGADASGVRRFLLTAGGIGIIFKLGASISGAEVGCQGEVGSACSMAAAGMAAALGGTPRQVENAAEIGMEHNLGLTCDPVGGLVQIPCIERNAVASVKAVTAARTALRGDGRHVVSLDQVIRTMRDTGRDMQSKYKETSLGGLAVNVVEC